jgi:ferric-dicitrate binding protein FerR (iron transport regulator)
MRHFLVAATMILGALIVTFGTASVLQGVATAHVTGPAEPFVVEAIRPAVKSTGTKERVTQARERIRTEAQVANW